MKTKYGNAIHFLKKKLKRQGTKMAKIFVRVSQLHQKWSQQFP